MTRKELIKIYNSEGFIDWVKEFICTSKKMTDEEIKTMSFKQLESMWESCENKGLADWSAPI